MKLRPKKGLSNLKNYYLINYYLLSIIYYLFKHCFKPINIILILQFRLQRGEILFV
jgi:hypothetical protein